MSKDPFLKTVYLWVCDWGPPCTPRISADLFFSSKERFYELWTQAPGEQLVPVQVPLEFDNLDYIPENY